MSAPGPELFIGLVGAAGTDLKRVRDALTAALRGVGYGASHVRVSSLIADVCGIDADTFPAVALEERRLAFLQNAGDRMRETARQGDAVIWLAIARIQALRAELSGKGDRPAPRRAFILDSLKHPSEVETLRRVYGDNFVLVSAYSPRATRLTNLKRRIARGHVSLHDDDFGEEAEALINIDEQRAGTVLGQNVRETFPQGDFFVSVDHTLVTEVTRFIHLLFGHPFITPTQDEHWMYHAEAEALRSADLSRQVGAVITGPAGNFLASGCNEVPHAGGGAYWPGSTTTKDNRDFVEGRDANAVVRYDIFKEFIESLRNAGLLSRDAVERGDEALTDDLLFGDLKSFVSDIRARNLIEFGRVVHAEMHALSEAARFGRAVAGATLYCTTFPCHMCARHLIAAGIRRIVFTEPYPKSMTAQLYASSVRVDGEGCDGDGTVRFEPFTGVAQRLYMTLFAARKRKNARGYAVEWDALTAVPKTVVSPASARYLASESLQLAKLKALKLEALAADVSTLLREPDDGESEPS